MTARSNRLAALADVDVSTLTDGQVLIWDASRLVFVPADAPTGDGGGSGSITGLDTPGLLLQQGQTQALDPVLEPHKRMQVSANAVVATNAASALAITTPDASGQVVEPAIEYVASKWNGHKFWGLITGYTNGNDATENPALYFSDDGQAWTHATGVPFPIVGAPSGGNNYDPELVLGPDGKLHGFWCSQVLSGGITNMHLWWTVFSPGTSGAVNMTTPIDILPTTQLVEVPVGPVFRWDGANNQWQMWYTDVSTFYNGVGGVYPSYYRTIAGTSPGGTMSSKTLVTMNGIPGGLAPFERHVSDYGDQLHMVITLCTVNTGGGATRLYFGVSNDNGLTWQLSTNPLLSPSTSGWDNGQIYRGDIIPIDDGTGTLYGLWYSADNGSSVWKMGYTTINRIPSSAGLPVGLTGAAGAVAATRLAGGTASGAPVTGTFAKGDHVVDQTGVVWICTAAGSPGTWANAAGNATQIDGVTITGAASSGKVITATSSSAATWSTPAGGGGGGGATDRLPGLVTPFNPLLLNGTTAALSLRIWAVRVVVPITGTLHDLYVWIGVSSGNLLGAVYDTGDALAGSRSLLWGGSSTPSAVNWLNLGDPALSVSAGQQLDIAVMPDNATVAIGDYAGSALDSPLPTNFLPATGGALPKLTWLSAAQGSFVLPSTVTEAAAIIVSGKAPMVMARVV